jgi:ATP-binding cassette subfamily B (MDR/TAP) protein 1
LDSRKLTARKAANKVFETIDRIPEIDSAAPFGQTLPAVQGRIAFQGIHFRYPSRPEVKIFRNFNLTIPSGATIALVGPSGNGKVG